MTQSLPRPTLPLSLVSLRLPETVDWLRKPAAEFAASTPASNVLALTPGVISEIAIELENSGPRPIRWTLEMTGNFPQGWYYPSLEEREEAHSMPTASSDRENEPDRTTTSSSSNEWQISGTIGPSDRDYPSVRLLLPINFFEAQTALSEQPTLNLNYDAEIFLFAHWQGQQRLAGYQSLRLEVRPDSDYKILLPEIFQSEDFMVRFLSIFEQTFDPSLQTLRTLPAYLDPLTAPRALLPFLSQWVAWDMNPRWSLKQQRRLIRYAIELYRWRGTKRGLRYYLHLYTNLPLDEDRPEATKHISITDETKNAFVFGQARLGEEFQSAEETPFALGGGQPFHFKVVLRPDHLDQIDEALVQKVIEQVKPAFCTYQLLIEPSQEPEREPEPQGSPTLQSV